METEIFWEAGVDMGIELHEWQLHNQNNIDEGTHVKNSWKSRLWEMNIMLPQNLKPYDPSSVRYYEIL